LGRIVVEVRGVAPPDELVDGWSLTAGEVWKVWEAAGALPKPLVLVLIDVVAGAVWATGVTPAGLGAGVIAVVDEGGVTTGGTGVVGGVTAVTGVSVGVVVTSDV
jgi:hypothetical protein